MTERGFYHPSRGYWQTTGAVPAEILDAYPAGTIEVPLIPGADYSWVEGEWVHTPPDPEVEAAARREGMSLSFAQLLIGLVEFEWITEAEGEAWLGGSSLPSEIEALIASLPEGERFRARARMLRMSVALRTDPLVGALAAARGLPDSEIDQFFEAYADV